MPNFSRGPEIEITTMQDTEMLKAMLAQNKIHIATKVLERSIVMPRDIDAHHPGYPKVVDTLAVNPYKEKKEVRKKVRKKGDDQDNN